MANDNRLERPEAYLWEASDEEWAALAIEERVAYVESAAECMDERTWDGFTVRKRIMDTMFAVNELLHGCYEDAKNTALLIKGAEWMRESEADKTLVE